MTAQLKLYIDLIKNRLGQITEIDDRSEVDYQVDRVWDELLILEKILNSERT